MARAKKGKRRSGRVFYTVYCCFIVVCLAVIALGCRSLWLRMEDYEQSMPKHVAARVEKMFTSRDFHTLYRYDDTSLFGQEGEDAYVDYLNRLTEGQAITCQESFSASEDEKKYQVKYGSNKLATFTLAKNGLKSERGNDLWGLKEVRTSVVTPSEYAITVPETSSVYADGVRLDDTSVTARGLSMDNSYLPAGFERGSWCTYTAQRCFSAPQFQVLDVKGREQKVIPTSGGLTVRLTYDDEEMRPALEEQVVTVAKAFAYFTSDDASSTAILRHVKDGSNAEKYIRGFDGGWFGLHKGVDFENMRTEKYVSYGEDAFSCDVRFDYIVRYKNKQTETFPTAYTLFFQREGEKWKLFDFTIVSGS